MNILWFTWKDKDNPLAGGAELINEELAARLSQDGHEVVFITAGFNGSKNKQSRRGFKIIRVGSRFTVYVAAFIEYKRHWANWPDLVIDECNTMPFFASFYTKGRQVLFFHMLCGKIWFYEFPPILSAIGYIAEPIYLRILKRNLPVITVSESTKQDLVRNGYRPKNIHIISEGINLDPIPNLNDQDRFPKPTLLSLGAIRPMKRTLDQIKAYELAKQKIQDLQLIIAGDASSHYGKRISAYVTRSPYAASIRQYGHVTPAEKLNLLKRSHVILSTSVKEGWGLTITEAASLGTPAAAYNADGLRDSIVDGVTGLLTRTNTPASLADTIQALLSNPASYKKLQTEAWKLSSGITFDQSYKDFKQALNI